METSLIGKALNFGFNEYGFESHVSNLTYNYAYSYTINMINVNSAKKNLAFNMVFTKKISPLLHIFKKYGLIRNYTINVTSKGLVARVYLSFYKNNPLCKNFKLISKPGNTYYISLRALYLVSKRTKNSIFILSTNKGLITHNEAILQKIGGVVIGFFSV